MLDRESSITTFHQLWVRAVERYPDNEFLLFRDDNGKLASWTYAEFDIKVAEAAGMLLDYGVERGRSIHIALRNSPAFVLVWLAAARLGAWIVPVDPASTARDIAFQLQRTSPTVGICATGREEVYREGAAGLLDTIITLDETASDLSANSPLRGVPSKSVVSHPTDRLAVMFTSGTTSAPKGVVLTQKNYVYIAESMSKLIDQQQADRWLVTLPMFHANAQYYCFCPAIAAGSSVALTASFSASGWLEQAAELEATHASLFAAPIRMILARRPADVKPLKMKHVWFAQSLGREHYREFTELIGCKPRQLYGMTETTAVVTADMSNNPRHDVIGTPIPGRAIWLMNPDTAREARVGEPGVLMVGGIRGVELFDEYLDDPKTTTQAFSTSDDNSWFLTGDLVQMDDDGVLRFVGRIDDVIKVAGENVSLTEVEAALAEAPGVMEVAVVAEHDPIRDQVPKAFIVPRETGNPPPVEALRLWVDKHLPPSSRPRSWTIVDELPRTSVGKIRRFQLQNWQESSQRNKKSLTLLQQPGASCAAANCEACPAR